MSGWVAAAQPPGGGATQPPGGGAQPPAAAWTSPTKKKTRRPGPTTSARRRWTSRSSSAFCVLAFVSFFRKSMTLKYVTLVASVIYLGVWKSTLISIVNVFGLFGGNLPIFRYNLAWYLLAVITVVSTDPVGPRLLRAHLRVRRAHAADGRVLPPRWQINVPRALERRAAWIKYGILAGVLVYFIVTSDPLIYPYIEPFWMFGLHLRTPVLLALLGTLLIATVFVRNLYCRFLCPLGAFLGILSNADRLPHQAVVRVQHLQDLREGLRVGRDRGPADHHDRVRALRRLRAALRGHEEVSAPPDHHQEGRHPRAARGVTDSGVLTPIRRPARCRERRSRRSRSDTSSDRGRPSVIAPIAPAVPAISPISARTITCRIGARGARRHGDESAEHGIDDPIREREQIVRGVVHRLAPGRVDVEHVQHLVGREGKNHDRKEPGEYRSNASSHHVVVGVLRRSRAR